MATPLPPTQITRQQDPFAAPLMEEMSIYALKAGVKELLEEYLKRVLVEKPKDPLQYLIEEIKNNPFVVSPQEEVVDTRPDEEKKKFHDLRRDETKMGMSMVLCPENI